MALPIVRSGACVLLRCLRVSLAAGDAAVVGSRFRTTARVAASRSAINGVFSSAVCAFRGNLESGDSEISFLDTGIAN